MKAISMTVWIVNPYGNLPGEGWRAYRETLLGEALAAQGHEVVWWVSNFEHRSKTFRTESWQDIAVTDRFVIRVVPSSSYSAHISLDRIRYERKYAHNLRDRVLADGQNPDVIVLAEPAPFTSGIIMEVVRATEARLVVDIIDLWPELFALALPRGLRAWSRFIFSPLVWRRAWLFRQADAFLAVSKDYLALAQSHADKVPATVVYLSLDLRTFRGPDRLDVRTSLPGLPSKLPNEIWGIYAGTLGDNYDLRTIMACAEQIQAVGLPIRIMIAGEGPLRAYVEGTIRDRGLTSTLYLGSLHMDDLRELYDQCDFALSTYVTESTVSMPVKAFDYLAAGLPIINSLGRDLGALVAQERVGLQYKPEDAEDLFKAVTMMAQDSNLRQMARDNALRVAQSFDTSVQYQKAVALIENLRPTPQRK
jgi:glycosyltransferase involved in cell wall biosynthesis